jgi:DnaJ-class molecular chaperone
VDEGADPSAVGRGENVHLEIEVLEVEAQGGTERVVRYPAMARCDTCLGDGTPGCESCGGTGKVAAQKRLALEVPPGLQDQAQLRVLGAGSDGGVGSTPGDLLVHVRVLPSPEDQRRVRYFALALLLIAVAMLVFYLIR